MVIGDLEGGGSQRVLVTLANAWADKGRKVCVITLGDGRNDRYQLRPGVTRFALGVAGDSHSLGSALVGNARRVLSLRRALRQAAAPLAIAFIAETNILAILACLGSSQRLVISERNDPSRQVLRAPWEFLRRHLYRYADLVTANSRGAVKFLADFVPEVKLFFVPNPVGAGSDRLASRPPGRTILNVASLSHQKAQDVLLRAFALILQEAPDWRLQIIGEGPRERVLRRDAEALGVSKRVDWVNWTPDIHHYYSSAGIFVLPSKFEGTPNALLEAMSYCLPVVVTDSSPGPLEYVRDGKSGLVVLSDDARSLADAMLRLIQDPELRSSLGNAARQCVAAYDLKSVMKTWELVLDLRTGCDESQAG